MLTVRESSRYGRLFRFVYGDIPDNFCLLFWGTLLMPLVAIVFGVMGLPGKGVAKTARLAHVEDALDRFDGWTDRHERVTLAFVVLILGAVCLYLLGVIAYAIYEWWPLGPILAGAILLGFVLYRLSGLRHWLWAIVVTLKGRTCPRVTVK